MNPIEQQLVEQLTNARPGPAGGYKSAGEVVVSGVLEITEPLVLGGGVHLRGAGRTVIVAAAPMPAMIYVKADPEPNYYGSYMGKLSNITFDANGLAEVCMQTGMVASYRFDDMRYVNALDVGADLSQIQNSVFINNVWEHNGVGGGPVSGGLRLSNGACTNRFIGCGLGNNWGRQLIFRDQTNVVADGSPTADSDLPASAAGPSQNMFLHMMIEDWMGRGSELIYARSGQGNKFDLCFLSHVRDGQPGVVTLVRMTAEDCWPGYETSSWLYRDCQYHGEGEDYVGFNAAGVWANKVRRGEWTGIPTRMVKDLDGAFSVAD